MGVTVVSGEGHQGEDSPVIPLNTTMDVKPSVHSGALCKLFCTEQIGSLISKAMHALC